MVASFGYVSSHKARGTRCAFIALLIIGCVSSWAVEPNAPGRLKRKADLFENPDTKARSLGKLPEGAVVTLIGQESGDFWRVEVELKDRKVLEGWIFKRFIQLKNAALTMERVREKNRVRREESDPTPVVPRDEVLLLRRENSFNYGLQLGGNFAIITNDADPSIHQGVGALVGGFFGIHLTQQIPLRFELNYSQYNGEAADGGDNLLYGFGFMEIALVPSFVIEPFEFFGGFHYAYGLSIQDVPQALNASIKSAADLSGVWFQGGAGYRIEFAKYAMLVARFRYSVSFSARNFFYQGFGATLAIQFNG